MAARALLVLPALVLASPALGLETKKPLAEQTAQDIQLCVQNNFPDDSMIQTVKMVSTDRLGVDQTLEAEMFWQKDRETRLSKVLLKFDNPPELRGAAVLVLEKKPVNDMFMFLPEIGRTKRITTEMVQGNMMGTDYSYEDFQRLQGLLSNLEGERKSDEPLDGRNAFVTESVPGAETGSEYTLIRSWVDQETCVPLKVELYAKGVDGPAKVMSVNAKSVSKEKTGWMPREIAMKDLRTGTQTRIVIEKLQLGVPIDRKRFSQTELDRQGRFGPAVTHY